MKLIPILITGILLKVVFADILHNSDFELAPSNWVANYTSPFFPLNENSTIPGWTFQGEGQYVGHAILLGQGGKLNQTFTANGTQITYLITFSLAIGGQNCHTNASLVISAPDSSAEFSFTQMYEREPSEVYGHQLGCWGNGESVNLVFESQVVDADLNTTCWPVIDNLFVHTVGSIDHNKDNLLPNGGFEAGPAFLEGSTEGVLLNSEPSLTNSPLQQWAITGTVKYINSQKYSIPEGKSAVEFVSGVSSGVQTSTILPHSSNYNLEFMLGDANDNCTGVFILGVVAGSSVQNFTINSNGTGSAIKHSLTFSGLGSNPTSISFQSYTAQQRQDGGLCGPVLDGVVLSISSRQMVSFNGAFLISLLVLILLKLSD